MATTYQAIASQVLASTATSVTFSSIPGTYTDLVLKVSGRSVTNAGIPDSNNVQFNGDTATNYSRTQISGDGAAANSITGGTVANIIFTYSATGNNATANTFGNFEMYLSNYAATTTKQVLGFGVGENNATTSYMSLDSALYRGTSAITSIKVFLNSGTNYAIGSRFDLYGITHF